jgi:hypothetical protein
MGGGTSRHMTEQPAQVDHAPDILDQNSYLIRLAQSEGEAFSEYRITC